METNKILHASLLDIIFEGRNKEYGAYELRSTYNTRLIRASMVTVVILSLLVTGYVFAQKIAGTSEMPPMIDANVFLQEVKPMEPEPEVVPPPKPVEPPTVATTAYTVPLIVNNELVSEDQAPPEVQDLDATRIGSITTDGVADDGISAPPAVEDKRRLIATPKADEYNPEKIFYKVEIESVYPGGASAWMRYLNKTFRYPSEAQEESLQGTVTVEFIVDVDGNVSNVQAISGPEAGGLRQEAIRVIQKSGKWEPAIQNGRKVNSYKKQPISFKLETE